MVKDSSRRCRRSCGTDRQAGRPASALDGSVHGLDRLDRAARRVGGQEVLDDPTILAPLVAYVGEVMRNATGGDWRIDAGPGREWEPVVTAAPGGHYRPFMIFKEILERGSMQAAVDVALLRTRDTPRAPRAGMFASQAPRIAAAIGALGLVPEDAYRVIKRYGDGRPMTVAFTRDLDVGRFPFADLDGRLKDWRPPDWGR